MVIASRFPIKCLERQGWSEKAVTRSSAPEMGFPLDALFLNVAGWGNMGKPHRWFKMGD